MNDILRQVDDVQVAGDQASSRTGPDHAEGVVYRCRVRVREGSPVEIFQFDRREKIIQRYGSEGLHATRVAEGRGQVHLTCLIVEPGGVIGTHPATATQLFLVIGGEGWTAGPDGERVPITTGWGVRWDAGENHTSGTETGLTALAIEGGTLSLFESKAPES